MQNLNINQISLYFLKFYTYIFNQTVKMEIMQKIYSKTRQKSNLQKLDPKVNKLSMVVTFYWQNFMWYTRSIWLNRNHVQKMRCLIIYHICGPLFIVLKTYFICQNIFFSALFFRLVVINFIKDVHWIFFQNVLIAKKT